MASDRIDLTSEGITTCARPVLQGREKHDRIDLTSEGITTYSYGCARHHQHGQDRIDLTSEGITTPLRLPA